MGLEVNDDQTRPVGRRIGEDIGQAPTALIRTAIAPNMRRAVGEQHPRQQMR